MKLSDFDYSYPEAQVAQQPLPQREDSRMMVVQSSDPTVHTHVRNLPQFLRAGDVLVLNTTKVLPVRLLGTKASGGVVEVLLLHSDNVATENVGVTQALPRGPAPVGTRQSGVTGPTFSVATLYWCLTTHTKRLQSGMQITFSPELHGTILERRNDEVLIQFNSSGNFETILNQIGLPPLPPYIVRNAAADYSASDRARYQTVFAEHAGSAAAPTAGLHLTPELIATLRAQGVTIAEVTLHVGRDTFQPVRVNNVADHKMHGEEWIISEDTADIVNQAKAEGRRVIAVGTTSVRALESAWDMDQGKLIAGQATTNIFITPGYIFRVIDGLMTNFHQPKSTLIMLVSALLGRGRVLALYAEAIRNGYRLFSFGDCMLIIKK